MTEKFHGAVLRCDGKIKDAHRQATLVLRGVSHAEVVTLGKGEALLVVFERDIRDDDYKAGIGRALKAFKFVKKVEPLQAASDGAAYYEQVNRIVDFALSLKPDAPSTGTFEDMADHLGRLRSWVMARNALSDAVDVLLHPGGQDGTRA